MLNQVTLVGRLVREPEMIETKNGNKLTRITLAIPRSYKNSDGEYDTDFVSCRLWKGIAENTASYCKKGDILGVKGIIQTSSYEKGNEKKYVTEIVAEKVSFLTNEKNHRKEKETKETEKELEM